MSTSAFGFIALPLLIHTPQLHLYTGMIPHTPTSPWENTEGLLSSFEQKEPQRKPRSPRDQNRQKQEKLNNQDLLHGYARYGWCHMPWKTQALSTIPLTMICLDSIESAWTRKVLLFPFYQVMLGIKKFLLLLPVRGKGNLQGRQCHWHSSRPSPEPRWIAVHVCSINYVLKIVRHVLATSL